VRWHPVSTVKIRKDHLPPGSVTATEYLKRSASGPACAVHAFSRLILLMVRRNLDHASVLVIEAGRLDH